MSGFVRFIYSIYMGFQSIVHHQSLVCFIKWIAIYQLGRFAYFPYLISCKLDITSYHVKTHTWFTTLWRLLDEESIGNKTQSKVRSVRRTSFHYNSRMLHCWKEQLVCQICVYMLPLVCSDIIHNIHPWKRTWTRKSWRFLWIHFISGQFSSSDGFFEQKPKGLNWKVGSYHLDDSGAILLLEFTFVSLRSLGDCKELGSRHWQNQIFLDESTMERKDGINFKMVRLYSVKSNLHLFCKINFQLAWKLPWNQIHLPNLYFGVPNLHFWDCISEQETFLLSKQLEHLDHLLCDTTSV